MKKNNKFLLAILFLSNLVAFAQPGGDGDNGLEGPDAPINTYLIVLMGVGLFLAYKFFKTYSSKKA